MAFEDMKNFDYFPEQRRCKSRCRERDKQLQKHLNGKVRSKSIGAGNFYVLIIYLIYFFNFTIKIAINKLFLIIIFYIYLIKALSSPNFHSVVSDFFF